MQDADRPDMGDLADSNGTVGFLAGSCVETLHAALVRIPRSARPTWPWTSPWLISAGKPWPDGQTPTFPARTPTLWICGDRHQDELRDLRTAFGLPPEAVRLNALPHEP